MSTKITAARLELCRMVRENCYSAVTANVDYSSLANDRFRVVAAAVLEVPIETMAGWFVMSDTVLANMRLAYTMVQDDLVY